MNQGENQFGHYFHFQRAIISNNRHWCSKNALVPCIFRSFKIMPIKNVMPKFYEVTPTRKFGLCVNIWHLDCNALVALLWFLWLNFKCWALLSFWYPLLVKVAFVSIELFFFYFMGFYIVIRRRRLAQLHLTLQFFHRFNS